jgi:myo-inositol-1(or 4)-monophosphatase
MYSIQDDLALMVAAAEKAGEIARTFQTEGFERLEDKSSGDPFLTEADLAIDKALRESLTAARPDYGWLSEETENDDSHLHAKRSFVVDPIDGTREFVERTGEFAISIGLIEDGKPVAGVIYNPMKPHMISGCVGTGVFLNGEKIKSAQTVTLKEADIIVSRSETRRGQWKPFKDTITTRDVGSVAYKLGLVAAGLADATASVQGKSYWDICAGHALCLAAGKVFTDLSGNDVMYKTKDVRVNGLVATQSGLHKDLLNVLSVQQQAVAG